MADGLRHQPIDSVEEDRLDAVPETLDQLFPEERHRIYAMLRLRVSVGSDGVLNVSGVLRCDPFVYEGESASTW